VNTLANLKALIATVELSPDDRRDLARWLRRGGEPTLEQKVAAAYAQFSRLRAAGESPIQAKEKIGDSLESEVRLTFFAFCDAPRERSRIMREVKKL
jgi:hypothetical protein